MKDDEMEIKLLDQVELHLCQLDIVEGSVGDAHICLNDSNQSMFVRPGRRKSRNAPEKTVLASTITLLTCTGVSSAFAAT